MFELFLWIYFVDVLLIVSCLASGVLFRNLREKFIFENKETIKFNQLNDKEKEWDKKYKILNFFIDFYYDFEILLDKPRDIYLEIKWFIQRGKQGYSDRDVWSIDYYLSNIIPEMLKKLKQDKIGLPSNVFPRPEKNIHTKKDWKIAEKRWNKILDTMVYTFETAKKMSDCSVIYCLTKDYYKKQNKDLRKRMSKLKYVYVMSYKECKRYEEGWKLFQTNFFSLWD